MGAIPKISALFETTLSAKITSSGSSASLDSVTDKAGVAMTGLYGFIIDEGSASEEFVIGTLAAKVLTITFRGCNPAAPYTEVTALKFAHARGASVKITDYPVLGLLRNIMNGDDGLPEKLIYDANPTFSNEKELISKKYADDLVIAGGVDASDSLKGISKLSVTPASPTNPIAVGDNDPRMITADVKAALAANPLTPNASNKFVNAEMVNTQTDNTIGTLVGGTLATSNYALWAVVTDGSFRISVDGTTYNIDAIDFTGDLSMADVATTLQIALRAATGGTETLVWNTDHFVITSTTSDENSEISVTETSTGTVGTDISGLGGTEFMDCDAGTATQGTSDHDKIIKLDTDGMIDESFIEKDTDTDLTADSDLVIASQKAVKAYVDNGGTEHLEGVGSSKNKTYLNFSLPWLKNTASGTEFWTTVGFYESEIFLSSISLFASNDVTTSIVTTERLFPEITFASTSKLIIEFAMSFAGLTGNQGSFGLIEEVLPLSNPTSDYDAISFAYTTDGKLYAHTGNKVGAVHTETEITGITLTSLNLYRIEWDPASEARFYINGVLKTTITTTLPNTYRIRFGLGANGNTNSHFPNIVSEPKVSLEIV